MPSLTGCRAQRQSNLKSQIEFQIEIQCSESMLSLISLTKSIFSVMSFTNILHLIQRPAPWHDWCTENVFLLFYYALFTTLGKIILPDLPLVVFSYAGDLLWFWDKKNKKKLEYHKIYKLHVMPGAKHSLLVSYRRSCHFHTQRPCCASSIGLTILAPEATYLSLSEMSAGV